MYSLFLVFLSMLFCGEKKDGEGMTINADDIMVMVVVVVDAYLVCV